MLVNLATPDSPPEPQLADLPPLGELKRAYDEDGFVHVPCLFSPSEISRFVNAADALLARETHGGVKHAYDASFSQVKVPASKDDTLRELTVDPRLALLAGVLSEMPRIRVYLDRILYKREGAGPTRAHVDAPFLSFDDPRALACWIALTDTNAENGALSYYVGSHHDRLTDKSRDPDGSISAHDPSLNAQLLRSVPARAGDVVFHNVHTIHLAAANITPETRRAYTIQYMPDGAAFAGETPEFVADFALAQGAPLDLPCFPRVL